MSRPEASRISISSERSVPSNESDNSNINDDLPAVGLTKGKTKAKTRKKVSFDFPVDVITKTGQTFAGIGTVKLPTAVVDKALQETKEEMQQVLAHFEHEMHHLMEREGWDELHRLVEREGRDELLRLMEREGRDELHRLMEREGRDELTKIQRAKPAKKRKSPEERAAKSKAAKEAIEVKRKELEAKREVIRKAIEDEKQAKADLEEANNIYKPGECLKHISVQLHPSLLASWYMQPTVGAARDAGATVAAAEDIFEPHLVTWTRLVPAKLAAHHGQMVVRRVGVCGHSVLVMSLAEGAALGGAGRAGGGGARALLRLVGDTKQRAPALRALILLNADTKQRKLSREHVNRAIGDLVLEVLVSYQMEVSVVDSPAELADLILHYTKAVAEEPYKKAKRDIDECADFYMRGDNKKCVTVDKQGNGLGRLWQQMLAVLPHSSLELARSLAHHYTAPAHLVQDFQSPGGVAKVADIGVSRTNVPGAKTRRIGPEFARKLYTLFTTEDGNTVIE